MSMVSTKTSHQSAFKNWLRNIPRGWNRQAFLIPISGKARSNKRCKWAMNGMISLFLLKRNVNFLRSIGRLEPDWCLDGANFQVAPLTIEMGHIIVFNEYFTLSERKNNNMCSTIWLSRKGNSYLLDCCEDIKRDQWAERHAHWSLFVSMVSP